MSEPKYPNVKVRLTGSDGNAFAIMAKCRKEASKRGVSREDIEAYTDEAMSGDYDHLLQTCMKYFEIS